MRKLVYTALTAALLVSACHSRLEFKEFDKPQSLADSIAYFLGMNNGFKIAADIDSMPADEKASFDRQRLLEGLYNGIMTDTTRQSILMGYTMVGLIETELSRYEKCGVKLDRREIVSSYREAFVDNAVDSAVAAGEAEQLTAFVAAIQQPGFDGKYDVKTRSRQFGHSAGQRFRQTMPQARTASGDTIVPDDFMKGLETILDVDDDDKGYSAGVNLGIQLLSFIIENRQLDINIDRERVFFHFNEAFNSSRRFTPFETIYFQQLLERLIDRAAELSPVALANAAEGKAYIDSLAMNSNELQISLSGLAYIIHRQGNGSPITEKSTFEMTYEGSLVDGTVFDRAESAIEVTGVGELIPGLREGVLLLRHGGEATFIIPGNLAYGVKGQQGKIPPMATLIYKIKIL